MVEMARVIHRVWPEVQIISDKDGLVLRVERRITHADVLSAGTNALVKELKKGLP